MAAADLGISTEGDDRLGHFCLEVLEQGVILLPLAKGVPVYLSHSSLIFGGPFVVGRVAVGWTLHDLHAHNGRPGFCTPHLNTTASLNVAGSIMPFGASQVCGVSETLASSTHTGSETSSGPNKLNS